MTRLLAALVGCAVYCLMGLIGTGLVILVGLVMETALVAYEWVAGR